MKFNFTGDKTKTQEGFFFMLNNLLDKIKQVIMTCDTYPKNINNLNERLISHALPQVLTV